MIAPPANHCLEREKSLGRKERKFESYGKNEVPHLHYIEDIKAKKNCFISLPNDASIKDTLFPQPSHISYTKNEDS